MGLPETLLLGFIAGVTIIFGLPVGRLRRPAPALRGARPCARRHRRAGPGLRLRGAVRRGHRDRPVGRQRRAGPGHPARHRVRPAHATEGFGIVAPLAGEPTRPSWGFLLTLALIGGGPTFIGTAVGHAFTSEPVSVIFLTLAAGSILYVAIQLLGVAARIRRSDILAAGLTLGLLAGFATDPIVTAAGA
jgi:hypothetical protein